VTPDTSRRCIPELWDAWRLAGPSGSAGRHTLETPPIERKDPMMTTTPQEPGSDPDVTPGGDPMEPADPIDPGTPTDPDETEHPE